MAPSGPAAIAVASSYLSWRTVVIVPTEVVVSLATQALLEDVAKLSLLAWILVP